MGMHTDVEIKATIPGDSQLTYYLRLLDSYTWEELEQFNYSEEPSTFIECERFASLFHNSDTGQWLYARGRYVFIDIKTDFKNYNDEIQHFIQLISPYLIGRKQKQYLGWYKYCESNQRTNLYRDLSAKTYFLYLPFKPENTNPITNE